MKSYKTVSTPSEIEYIDKKSRFIAYCQPVTTEEEALGFLNAIRTRYRDATHHVYAYSLRDQHIQRFSDDGEPQGTSGLPTLEVLTKGDITDAIIVTVRYFGGTLLGTGGLVRAYGKSAREALLAANPVEKVPCMMTQGRIDYSNWGKLQAHLLTEGLLSGEVNFGADVVFPLALPATEAERLKADLIDRTNGLVCLQDIGIEYFDKPIEV